MSEEISDALINTLISNAEVDQHFESANVVDGLFAIARALGSIANAIDRLGVNDAATPLGAIEALSMEVKNGFGTLSSSVDSLSESVMTFIESGE